jgi:hypothetical protein
MHNAILTFKYMHLHHTIIIHTARLLWILHAVYYLLSVYEVIGIMGLEIVIIASSKYKKTLPIVEYYYSYHTC